MTQRIEVEPTLAHALDGAQELRVIEVVGDGVEGGRVHDQQRRLLVVVEEVRIGLVELLEVGPVDELLHPDPPPRDALHQHIYRCLQVDHEVGLRRIDDEPRVDLFVQRILGILERDPGEQAVLLEQVIRHPHRREQVLLTQARQLLRVLEEEVQLRRQGRTDRIAVEAFEERVAVGLLLHRLRTPGVGEAARERGLADPDRTFDDDETMLRGGRHRTVGLR